MTRTKLVATIGPATQSEDMLRALIEQGVDVFRLNFSHGTLESHLDALNTIRQLSREMDATVAVMGDLCGPKIRLGKIEHGHCVLKTGEKVIFQRTPVEGNSERLSSTYPAFVDDVEPGHRILIDDGNVQLRVEEKKEGILHCVVEEGGPISDHKGVNLPDSNISAPALTEKDRKDLAWALEHGLDFVALSFVRKADDLEKVREIINQHDRRTRLVSKIERPEAIENLHAIARASDVVLVARGDLGVEMDVSSVPILQKEIALLCHRLGKPVIIATQMLQSMVDAPVPTRAEVSDVANAILDYADAVMLSAETSIGQFPLHAVKMIRRIAAQTESFKTRYREEIGSDRVSLSEVTNAVVDGVSLVAGELQPRLIAAWTEDDETPRLLSKHRLDQPIVALATDAQLCRQMAILYGVIPIQLKCTDDLFGTMRILDKMLLDRELAMPGERVIVTTDTRKDLPGETDAMFIHEVGSINHDQDAD